MNSFPMRFLVFLCDKTMKMKTEKMRRKSPQFSTGAEGRLASRVEKPPYDKFIKFPETY